MRRPVLVTTAALAAGLLLLAGCGGTSSGSQDSGQDTTSNAYKLASFDQGSYADANQVAQYQRKLDKLNAYCREDEDQLTRGVDAAATKLTDEGVNTSRLGFMRAFLFVFKPITPHGVEDCVGGFALIMSAIREDGGTA